MKRTGEAMVARRRRLSLRWSAGDAPGAAFPAEIDLSQPQDIQKLDSYSQAIATVVHKVGRAIVSVQSGTPETARSGVGLGSACVVSPQGILLTSSQVVQDSEALTVRFPDGQRLEARVLGVDPSTDVGLLEVSATGLPCLSLEDLAMPQIGETVLAVGNPHGHHSVVSTGVITTQGRSLRSRGHRLLEGLIQHTARLGPGMAGGALLDRSGHLVGILTENVALGHADHFAFPIQTAIWALPQLHSQGVVRRGRIGVAGEAHPLTADQRQQHGLQQDEAIAVLGVESGGPAARGGLQQGDWIIQLNGQSCTSLEGLDRFLSEWPLRRPLRVTVLRGAQKIDLTIQPMIHGS